MSARDELFAAVRRAVDHRVPHPGAYAAPDLPSGVPAFAEALAAAGGEAQGPFEGPALADVLRGHLGSGRIVATTGAARRLGPGPWQATPQGAPPHASEDVETAIAEGVIGVAESGAVAVGSAEAPDRALLFLAEHVVLLLDAARIVGDLHRALGAIPDRARTAHHLTWICGPSKTADIEQTLVHGAHGPRTLTVMLYTSPEPPPSNR